MRVQPLRFANNGPARDRLFLAKKRPILEFGDSSISLSPEYLSPADSMSERICSLDSLSRSRTSRMIEQVGGTALNVHIPLSPASTDCYASPQNQAPPSRGKGTVLA